MQFKTVAVPYFYYIADQVGIVDQKVWSKIANPVTYPDKNPVGTGAYTVSSNTCTPQNIKYTANPHYWQPGLPKVGTVNYPCVPDQRHGQHLPGQRPGAVGQPVHPDHPDSSTCRRARTTTTGSRRSRT